MGIILVLICHCTRGARWTLSLFESTSCVNLITNLSISGMGRCRVAFPFASGAVQLSDSGCTQLMERRLQSAGIQGLP